MVQLILGKKGKGKTKIILDMVNKEVNDAKATLFTWIKAWDICMN